VSAIEKQGAAVRALRYRTLPRRTGCSRQKHPHGVGAPRSAGRFTLGPRSTLGRRGLAAKVGSEFLLGRVELAHALGVYISTASVTAGRSSKPSGVVSAIR